MKALAYGRQAQTEDVSWARCHGPHRGAFRKMVAAKESQGQQPGLLTAGSGTTDLFHFGAGFLLLKQEVDLRFGAAPPAQHLRNIPPLLVHLYEELSSFSLPLGVQEILRRW